MTTRRDFLNLLGFGAAAAATSGAGVFSSRGSDLLIGDGGDHYIFEPKARNGGVMLSPDARAWHLFKSQRLGMNGRDEPMVGTILMRNNNAYKGTFKNGKWVPSSRNPWTPPGEVVVYETPEIRGLPGEDPHVTYYVAASQLRRRINDDIMAFRKELAKHNLVMVTVVSTPIIAMPDPNSGYSLFTEIRQFACHKEAIVNADKAISTMGEVPIETPSDIEFNLLLRTDEELRRMGVVSPWNQREGVAVAMSRVVSRGGTA